MSKQKIVLDFYKILWENSLKNENFIFNREKTFYVTKVIPWANSVNFTKITSLENLIEIIKKISIEKVVLSDMSTNNIINNCLIELITNANIKERKIIFQNIHCLVSEKNILFFEILQNIKEKVGNEVVKEIFLNLPKEIMPSGRRNGLSLSELKEKLQKLFSEDKDIHSYLLSFLSLRSKKMNLSQSGAIELRDFLIEEYKYDKERLKEFIPYSLSLEKYLKTDNDGDFFVKEKGAFLIETIDVEQMKAVVALKNWRTHQYIHSLELLMNLYKIKVNSIKNISLIHNKISRKEYHIDLYVNIKENEEFKLIDFQNKIRRFSKVLANGDLFEKNYQYLINIQNLDKWWNADELSLVLDKKDNTAIKKSKL